MSNSQFGTPNTLAMGSKTIGGDFPVWARVNKCYQGGGFINTASLKAGDIIAAGTPVIFNSAGNEVTIVAITDKAKLAQVNGLVLYDVCIPSNVVSAACAVCYDGRVYANRANGGNGLPASLKKNLPAVEFVYDGAAPAEPA